MLFKIALRNVIRHWRRTLLTGFIIAFGLWIYLFMDSLFTGIDRSMVENLVNLTESSLKLYTADYDSDRKAFPLKYGINEKEKLSAYFKNIKEIAGTTPRTRFIGEIAYNGKSRYLIGTIIDPKTDELVFTIKEYVQGDYFSEASQGEILIGDGLAKKMGVVKDDYITIMAKTRDESYNALDYKIVGLLHTSSPEINDNSVYLTYQGAQSLLALDNLITEWNVKLTWPKGQPIPIYKKNVQRLQDKVTKDLPEYRAYGFQDQYGSMLALIQQKTASGKIMTFMILLIAGVGIVNSILMSVYERIREIGVLKSLGMKAKDIKKLFIIEGMITGFAGGFMGLLFGALSNVYLIYFGYNIEDIAKGMDAASTGFPVWGVFYGQWNPDSFLLCMIIALLLSFIASYIPAKQASKMEATRCLKFV